MGRAKEIIVKVIPSKIANDFVKKQHYSNKIAATAELHFGCFLDKKLIGSFQRDTEGYDLKTPKLSKGPDIFCDIVEEPLTQVSEFIFFNVTLSR